MALIIHDSLPISDCSVLMVDEDEIMALLTANRGNTPAEIKEALLRHFRKRTRNALTDDLTIVICTRSSPVSI